MGNLRTRWGESLDSAKVHEEYPRPQMVRDSFQCLNGTWNYAIRKNDRAETYDGTILVPFSPETELSGVQRLVRPPDYLHYGKEFTVKDEFCKGKRVFLHFGAVDQECEVFLNGNRLGEHSGGYLPFSFEITRFLQRQNTLTLVVRDYTELSAHARGKQKLTAKGRMSSIFYSPSSGIWQSVWMEAVPERFIERIRTTPDLDRKSVTMQVITAGDIKAERKLPLELSLFFQGEELELTGVEQSERSLGEDRIEHVLEVPVRSLHLWSPEQPDLYDVRLRYGEDEVTSYFGMRKIHKEKDHKGIWRFYLNNEPVFMSGVLDQGYWPESLLTPPSDEALEYDILKLKELGFNTIRKHVKVESDRFYYHCDRLGMLVWQDMPNGGGDYNMMFVTYLPNGLSWFGRVVSDCHYSLFKREDSTGRQQFYRDLRGMVETLYNHPSIVLWTPFNEGWGQFDASKATELIRSLDHTRLINEACGWFDQGGGDVYSIHNYLRKLHVRPNRKRIVGLTEFGGYAYPEPGHLACEKEFGYQGYQSREALGEAFCKLYERDIYPNIPKGLSSAIYTQTSDIQEEINGFMTYDRKVDKIPGDLVQEVNRKLQDLFHVAAKSKG